MKSRNLIYLSSVFYLFAAHISATGEKIDNSVQAQSMLAVLYAQSSAEYEANERKTKEYILKSFSILEYFDESSGPESLIIKLLIRPLLPLQRYLLPSLAGTQHP